MRLFLAEKPSLARAIADVLPGPHQKRGGFIECGGGNVVTWCAGHILELADPEAYRPEFKTWALEHLPIVPDRWKLTVTAPDLYKTIQSLLPKAREVVHAGDPDREGQLLVDEVLEHLSYRGPVSRVLISDLNPEAVRKALGSPSAERQLPRALRVSASSSACGLALWAEPYPALHRARQGGGYDGMLSVGRVQTPLLGLIVRRDLEIEGFIPKPFYVLSSEIGSSGGAFRATWTPGDAAAAALDDEKRLGQPRLRRRYREEVQRAARSRRQVRAREEERSAAPPYSLADLQVDAGKRLGLSPKETLDASQALYETHRLVTYPRSDCQHLPTGHHGQAATVLAAVAQNAPHLASLARAATPTLRSRAWDDAKVTAHHAIIPTPVGRAVGALAGAERAVYDLIVRRYIAQFYPAYEFNQTHIVVDVAGERFTANGRQPLVEGWRVAIAIPPTVAGDDEKSDEDDPSKRDATPATRGRGGRRPSRRRRREEDHAAEALHRRHSRPGDDRDRTVRRRPEDQAAPCARPTVSARRRRRRRSSRLSTIVSS